MPPLPSIVFEHFRQPRHQGPLPDAQATGQIEGRREDASFLLHLSFDDEVATAQFEVVGDRSAVAALSLLTTWLNGKSRAEVEGLTLEALADHYGLPAEMHPMLVPAIDTLTAALANLRGEANPFAREGEVICTCLFVRRERILRTIRERRLETVAEVRHWTRACTGCRSCREDVELLLDLSRGQP